MLYCKKYGFREKHTTVNALVPYTENLRLKGKKLSHSFSWTFVRHSIPETIFILLSKLASYGFEGIATEQ